MPVIVGGFEHPISYSFEKGKRKPVIREELRDSANFISHGVIVSILEQHGLRRGLMICGPNGTVPWAIQKYTDYFLVYENNTYGVNRELNNQSEIPLLERISLCERLEEVDEEHIVSRLPVIYEDQKYQFNKEDRGKIYQSNESTEHLREWLIIEARKYIQDDQRFFSPSQIPEGIDKESLEEHNKRRTKSINDLVNIL